MPIPQPSPQPATTRQGRTRRDLVALVLAVGLYWTLATRLELFEVVSGFAQVHESWQLDELPLTLLVLSLGLTWFGWRRVQEARAALHERTIAQAEVAALLAQNRDLAQRLILAQEQERRTLARELHDELGQHCTAMRAEARFIQQAHAHTATGDSAGRIGASAERLYGLVKGMLNRLRPPALDSLGLEMALLELCDGWEQQTGIACRFMPTPCQTPSPHDLDDATAVTLYRLVQEALTNVARHAQAQQVWVNLTCRGDGCLHLQVKDDGQGLPEGTPPRHGLGLIGMQERVAALHGTLQLHSQPGQGLCIDITLPSLPPTPSAP
ncbi:ATP-binding protein [Aquabacterium sp.]|uniref:ATP-binding protein n=1 Tax=Aquabacterium sp. TaxID=1872578 RepID=UPI0025BA13BA|nr:ATP-binding protein [Aquabacterium sp.]